MRWLAFLGQYDVEICHLPGTTNTAADALSRLCVLDGESYSWEESYKADPWVMAKYYFNGRLRNPLCWHHGRIWDDDRIVVPSVFVSRTMADHHSSILSGHWGLDKTLTILQRKFKFEHMHKVVKDFVQACDLCQRTKAERQHKRGLLEPLTMTKRKWQSVSLDWVV